MAAKKKTAKRKGTRAAKIVKVLGKVSDVAAAAGAIVEAVAGKSARGHTQRVPMPNRIAHRGL